ncbi:hypothetical protein [Marinilactibacillus sp. Marseille-P9653]|nr:hypothetical protein [Marinilactibacillus sp. Marseille-P9653]
MVLKSIKSEFNNGATLKDMDFANMTQNDYEQAERDKMAVWFTETGE